MLDPGQDAQARDAIAAEVRSQIEGAGSLKHENVWGLRKLAYEIGRRTEADYRWFRFEGTNELLEQLDHNLKIADGVLRFRVFKVDAETPIMVPPAAAAPGPGSQRDRSEHPRSGPRAQSSRPAAVAEAPPAPAPEGEAEQPAEAADEPSE